MALQTEVLERKFVYQKDNKTIILHDPGMEFTPHKVKQFYITEYPELLTGSVEGPNYEENKAVYILKPNAGTKG